MRKMAIVLMASVAGLAANVAMAADAVDRIPEAPASNDNYGAPVGNWSGAYLGGSANYNMGRFRTPDDFDATGLGGSVYGGYNMQSGKVVYGAEADIGYSGVDTGAGPGLVGKQGWNGSVRGRVGYDVAPFLLYGTAGLAVTNNKLSNATDSDKRTSTGYTVGAGAEAMVTNNITARVEYRYSDYGSRDFDLGGTNVRRDYEDHSVKVGVGVKF